MQSGPDLDIHLKLDDVGYLFDLEEADPLAGQFQSSSGMDQIKRSVGSRRISASRNSRIIIALPAEDITPDLEQRVRNAIAGYCTAHIADIRQILVLTRHEGLQTLWVGLGFLAVCLSLSSLVYAATAMVPFLQRLFGEGLVIAGWVGLWRPTELLLYDSWPFRRDLRVMEVIGKMDVVLIPHEDLPATAAAATTAATRRSTATTTAARKPRRG